MKLARQKGKYYLELSSLRLKETLVNVPLSHATIYAQTVWEQPNNIKKVFSRANVSLDVVLRSPRT